MECKKCQEMISLYIDNALTSDEKKQFEAHMAICSECREELEFMQKLMMHVHDLDDEKELPSDFHGNLMDKIDCIEKPHNLSPMKKMHNIRKYYSALAAVFVAVLIFGIIGIANLDKFANLPMKNDKQMESADDAARSGTAENTSNRDTNYTGMPSKNIDDGTMDKDQGKSIGQYAADEPRTEKDENAKESPSIKESVPEDAAGDIDVRKDAPLTTEESSLHDNNPDKMESSPSDGMKGEDVKEAAPDVEPLEKGDTDSKIGVTMKSAEDVNGVQFNEHVNQGTDKSDYSLTAEQEKGNTVMMAKKHLPDEEPLYTQPSFILTVVGIFILGILILVYIKRKRK